MGGSEGALTMPRADLLALSLEDLTALTNRGTVKRAQRELEAGEVSAEMAEMGDGTIKAHWSDGVQCLLPGGLVLSQARCSCVATELCRHIIRTVLAYQQQTRSASSAADGPWNPGRIGDEALAVHFKPAALKQAQEMFRRGLLLELVLSQKPTARFHDLACTLRFQVPDDIRYVHCDCAAPPPCIHVPLAIWGFRRLQVEQTAAILSTQEGSLPVPAETLDAIDETLLAGTELGLSGGGTSWRDRLTRLATRCTEAGLVWPADVLNDLIHCFERYTEHDARFAPDHLAELVGELLIRSDAIRNDTGVVPQPLIRGTASDQATELASARFIGLGCGVQAGRRVATFSAFLQDANSGSMVAVSREFPDPPPDATESPRPFWQLAQTPALKGASFGVLGAGQLLTKGGKRTTSHELILGRAKATVNPQNFSWENLRPPVLVESFAEVRARLSALPPASLRPRRVAEDFHVCPVAAVESATFLPAQQTVAAMIQDSLGDRAMLRHPFLSRGSDGAEHLLKQLSGAPALLFVAGVMRLSADELLISPVALVFGGASGRTMLQPWIDRAGQSARQAHAAEANGASADPVATLCAELLQAVGDLLVIGLRRADPSVLRIWQDLARQAESLGLSRMAVAIAAVSSGLAEKASVVRWDWKPTGETLVRLALLARLATDLTWS
jgi:hypothetical protein